MATNVQGWKINLKPYQYDGLAVRDGLEVKVTRGFDVVESLASLVFSRDLALDPDGMFRAKDIADKIRAAGETVTLDEQEMEHLNEAYKLLRGLPEYFIECLARIRDAVRVELTDKG